jgi:putative transcriptional regulator
MGSITCIHAWSRIKRGKQLNYIIVIIVNLDVMLAKRKMSLTELSERVGITMSNLSILKKGKAKAIRFSTLESICRVLDCQPADILEYKD